MKDIIAEAHSKRFKIPEDDQKKSAILISDSWFEELKKHPYYSSKNKLITYIEKPGTGVFLLKESAKLYKVQKNRTVHSLSKRLAPEEHKMDGVSEARPTVEKRMKGIDCKTIVVTDGLAQIVQKKQ